MDNYNIDEKLKEIEDILPGGNSIENIEKSEKEFLNEFLNYNEDVKNLKLSFKNITAEYQASGVNTKVIIRAAKQIARNNKKNKQELTDEERIFNNLYNDKDLMLKICSILN